MTKGLLEPPGTGRASLRLSVTFLLLFYQGSVLCQHNLLLLLSYLVPLEKIQGKIVPEMCFSKDPAFDYSLYLSLISKLWSWDAVLGHANILRGWSRIDIRPFTQGYKENDQAGEMAHLVKYMPHKHEELSVSPQQASVIPVLRNRHIPGALSIHPRRINELWEQQEKNICLEN